jgi:aminoglycoside phosphotransferase
MSDATAPPADLAPVTMRPAASPERQVLKEMMCWRDVRAIRTFRHGAGGTMLIRLEGEPVVLKAWPVGSPLANNLERARRLTAVMRESGAPIPAIVEHGEAAGQRYTLYERMPGRRPARVTAGLLHELLAVVELERAAAPPLVGGGWRAALTSMLYGDGDPLFEIFPDKLLGHRHGRRLLERARRCLRALDVLETSGTGIMHGDLAPENALVHDGTLSAVVDWEQCREGDPNLDLVGILFDLELESNAGERPRAEFRRTLRDTIAEPLLALYVSIYAARYASWAIGTHLEADVFALGDRLNRDFVDPN